ncbi:MAG: hypothetical protein E7015_01550 [Alphaproteobacteria bacterium]|nr:hypothetical protein [Alphaproteobacteria bacterium]
MHNGGIVVIDPEFIAIESSEISMFDDPQFMLIFESDIFKEALNMSLDLEAILVFLVMRPR